MSIFSKSSLVQMAPALDTTCGIAKSARLFRAEHFLLMFFVRRPRSLLDHGCDGGFAFAASILLFNSVC